MKLEKLLDSIGLGNVSSEDLKKDVTSLCDDSRKCQPGSLFVAVKGTQTNGHNFIASAIANGAQFILKDKEAQVKTPEGVSMIEVQDTRQVLQPLAARFYSPDFSKVKSIGVTGTNGKTTVTYCIESILRAAKKTTSVTGTINSRIGDQVLPTINTTPGLLDNYALLGQLVRKGVEYSIMEVSSHALDQDRVQGIPFSAAVFTNLTDDHLDYHLTREAYFSAKAKLFQKLSKDSAAVINKDDDCSDKLIELTSGKVLTYGIKNEADFMACDIKSNLDGVAFLLKTPKRDIMVQSRLIGRHNIYNILAAAAACYHEGIAIDNIQKGIELLKNIPGRLERIDVGQEFFVFVDYAHTEDGLKNVLESIREVSSEALTVVFGCGGDRDRSKRPRMGAITSKLADRVIVTSDNPRSEDPQSIIDEICKGSKGKNITVVLDREEAIACALTEAQKRSIVVVAGKGHEDYQIFKDRTIHFDDREVVRECLMARK